MKKTTFYISVYDSETKGKQARPVNGYFEHVAGLPLGFHKTGAVWTCSELSTGVKIAEGRTRADALEKARPYFDKVCLKIIDEKMRGLREIISAAYKEVTA